VNKNHLEEFILIKEAKFPDQKFSHLSQDVIFHVFEDPIAVFLEGLKDVLSLLLFSHYKYKSQFHGKSQISIQLLPLMAKSKRHSHSSNLLLAWFHWKYHFT
jgi:hypothetical protein